MNAQEVNEVTPSSLGMNTETIWIPHRGMVELQTAYGLTPSTGVVLDPNSDAVAWQPLAPTFIGAPGLGKTAGAIELCRKFGIPLHRIHAGMDGLTLGAIQVPVEVKPGELSVMPEGGVALQKPAALDILKSFGSSTLGMLFLDEIIDTTRVAATAMLDTLQFRRVSSTVLPPSIWVSAAGNFPSIATSPNDLAQATCGRLAIWAVQPPTLFDTATNRASVWERRMRNGKTRTDMPLTEVMANVLKRFDGRFDAVSAMYRAFGRLNEHVIMKVMKSASVNGPQVQGRTIDAAFDLVCALEAQEVPRGVDAEGFDLWYAALAGAVGATMARQILAFVEVGAKLPDPEAVLKDPSLFEPTYQALDQAVMMGEALIGRVQINPSLERKKALAAYFVAMSKGGCTEFATKLVADAVKSKLVLITDEQLRTVHMRTAQVANLAGTFKPGAN